MTTLDKVMRLVRKKIKSIRKKRKARRRRLHKKRVDAVVAGLFPEFQPQVLAGPFAGMPYELDSFGSQLVPKILGTYENELETFIEMAIARSPKCIAVVGAAEGYYAIGLAHRLRNSKIFAWEQSPEGRVLFLKNLGAYSMVEAQIYLNEEWSVKDFSTQEFDLVIMDIEGGELNLIQAWPSWASKCFWVIEYHDHIVPRVSWEIESRLRESHQVFRLNPKKSKKSSLNIGQKSLRFRVQLSLALNEFRKPGNGWLIAVPQAKNNASGV